MKRKLVIGFDFDGVIVYNPFRLVRAPWAYFKNKVLKKRQLSFFYPVNKFQKIIWRIMHDSSILPAKGKDKLAQLIKSQEIEAHLITGRYSFLDNHLHNWLNKYRMKSFFKSINCNKKDQQPHLFKEEKIKKLNLDIYIEDNWDIVQYLAKNTKAKIFWIYNLVDRGRDYRYKYPYLEKALDEIIRSSQIS